MYKPSPIGEKLQLFSIKVMVYMLFFQFQILIIWVLIRIMKLLEPIEMAMYALIAKKKNLLSMG